MLMLLMLCTLYVSRWLRNDHYDRICGCENWFKIINKSRIFFYWQFVCVMAWCVWTVDAPLTPVLYIYTSHSLKVSTPIYCCKWIHINIRYRLFPFLCSVGKGEVRHWCVQWRCWCTDLLATFPSRQDRAGYVVMGRAATPQQPTHSLSPAWQGKADLWRLTKSDFACKLHVLSGVFSLVPVVCCVAGRSQADVMWWVLGLMLWPVNSHFQTANMPDIRKSISPKKEFDKSELRERLTPTQYQVTQEHHTEK